MLTQTNLARVLMLAAGLILAHSLPDCDFERHQGGCFSQANLECDTETYKCRCQAPTPVLIDDHFCVERAKAHKSCKYSAQCDIELGFHCYVWPPVARQSQLALCRPPHTSCRCRSNLTEASHLDEESEADGSHQRFEPAEGGAQIGQPTGKLSRGSHQASHAHGHGQGHSNLSNQHHQNIRAHSSHNRNIQQQIQQQILEAELDKSKYSAHHHFSLGTLFSRFVWIFLIIVLLALITLLVLIEYRSFRRTEPTFHQQAEDRVSINSEVDVPPPYEVAIRMKD